MNGRREKKCIIFNYNNNNANSNQIAIIMARARERERNESGKRFEPCRIMKWAGHKHITKPHIQNIKHVHDIVLNFSFSSTSIFPLSLFFPSSGRRFIWIFIGIWLLLIYSLRPLTSPLLSLLFVPFYSNEMANSIIIVYTYQNSFGTRANFLSIRYIFFLAQ